MAGDYAYEGLTVSVRERGDAGQVEFGVVVEGAFIPFASGKLEGFREDLQEAREQAQAEQQQQPAQAQAGQPQPQTSPPEG